MGFWEKMMGRTPEAPQEAPASPEGGPSPELAAEAEKTKEHLSALEKLVDDPRLEEKLQALPPEKRATFWQDCKRLGATVLSITAPLGTIDVAAKAVRFAEAGHHETAMTGVGLALAGLGVSVASLRYVWKRARERMPEAKE